MTVVHRLAVLGVPTSAGAHAPGQEQAPDAFRQAGIVALLASRGFAVDDRGDLARVRWTPDRQSPRAQHKDLVAEVAESVATAVVAALEGNDAIVVLGGDCTIEVGVVSGFARAGERVGLVYLDAGPDLNVPSAVRLGFLDWMGTAHLLGLAEATEPLSHIGPHFPLLEPDQIVFVGAIPDELTEWEQKVVEERGLRMIWSDDVSRDPRGAARQALSMLEAQVDRILVHFDVDVIDFIDFPAADFATINAGLTLAEAMACLGELALHSKFAAVTVCEFNPDHVDEGRLLVRQFADDLVDALPAP
jgi:arginase